MLPIFIIQLKRKEIQRSVRSIIRYIIYHYYYYYYYYYYYVYDDDDYYDDYQL